MALFDPCMEFENFFGPNDFIWGAIKVSFFDFIQKMSQYILSFQGATHYNPLQTFWQFSKEIKWNNMEIRKKKLKKESNFAAQQTSLIILWVSREAEEQ